MLPPHFGVCVSRASRGNVFVGWVGELRGCAIYAVVIVGAVTVTFLETPLHWDLGFDVKFVACFKSGVKRDAFVWGRGLWCVFCARVCTVCMLCNVIL